MTSQAPSYPRSRVSWEAGHACWLGKGQEECQELKPPSQPGAQPSSKYSQVRYVTCLKISFPPKPRVADRNPRCLNKAYKRQLGKKSAFQPERLHLILNWALSQPQGQADSKDLGPGFHELSGHKS